MTGGVDAPSQGTVTSETKVRCHFSNICLQRCLLLLIIKSLILTVILGRQSEQNMSVHLSNSKLGRTPQLADI